MKNKVCVYAICKNEFKFIDQWLHSMEEADYIVVLDTGSTDGTYEKLKSDPRVTKVEQKIIDPWRFDVARNESMKLVPKTADILVCTDLDEWFEPGWCNVLKQVWQDNVNRVHYQYAWNHTETGIPTDVFTYDKIHTRDYHWVYPVHEVLMPKNSDHHEYVVDVKDQIYLHHFQDVSKPRSSYLPLLQLSVEENPDDCHVLMLLAREYLIHGESDKALELYLKVLESSHIDEPQFDLVKLETLNRIGDIYITTENYSKAIEYYQKSIAKDSTYREPYLGIANVYVNMKLYTLAEATLSALEKYATRKYTWVEQADTWVCGYEDTMSVIQYHLKNYDAAIELGRKVYECRPNDQRTKDNLLLFYIAKDNERKQTEASDAK